MSIKTAPSGRNEPADDPEQPEADNELSLFAVLYTVEFTLLQYAVTTGNVFVGL